MVSILYVSKCDLMHVGFREHVTGCFVEQYGVDTITVNILCPLCEFYFFFLQVVQKNLDDVTETHLLNMPHSLEK